MVEERKEEKRRSLKENLQQKLKTIRDRRVSGVNLEPFPEGAFELLESNNIWEEILGFLNDPVDVTSAYHTCPEFAENVRQRRTQMLMPRVLTNLKWYSRRSLAPAHWRTICFSIRGVCQAWKEIANFQLFDSPFDGPIWFERAIMPSHYDSEWTSTSCLFKDEESVDRATSVLSWDHRPSFSIRTVMVILNEGVTEEFYRKVIDFLRIHGGSVWFFVLKWGWRFTGNMGQSYEKLCEMLEALPNLKGLHLNDNHANYRAVQDIQDFQRATDQRPLPVLGSLEHLFCILSTGEALLTQISQKCDNLKSLVYLPSLYVPGPADATVESLRGLRLQRYCGPPGPILMRPLMPLTSVWPLKHLAMDLKESVMASVLFPALNRFRETLKELQISKFPIRLDTTAGIRNICLDLPRLTSLSLHTIGHFCGSLGFDDLLLLRSLEEFHVTTNILQEGIVEYLGEDANSKVKVAEYLKNWNMNKSNVWVWFPKLMSIKFSCYSNIFCRPN